jgi:hypothetical protein
MRGINTQCIRQHLKKRQNGAPTFKKTFEKGHFPAGRRGSEKCDQQHSGEKRLTRGQSKTSDLQGKIQVLAPKARLQAIFRQTSNGHSQFGKTSSLEDAKEWNKKHPRKTKTSELKAGPSGGATASSGTASGAAPPVPMTPTAGPSPGGAAASRATTPAPTASSTQTLSPIPRPKRSRTPEENLALARATVAKHQATKVLIDEVIKVHDTKESSKPYGELPFTTASADPSVPGSPPDEEVLWKGRLKRGKRTGQSTRRRQRRPQRPCRPSTSRSRPQRPPRPSWHRPRGRPRPTRRSSTQRRPSLTTRQRDSKS